MEFGLAAENSHKLDLPSKLWKVTQWEQTGIKIKTAVLRSEFFKNEQMHFKLDLFQVCQILIVFFSSRREVWM